MNSHNNSSFNEPRISNLTPQEQAIYMELQRRVNGGSSLSQQTVQQQFPQAISSPQPPVNIQQTQNSQSSAIPAEQFPAILQAAGSNSQYLSQLIELAKLNRLSSNQVHQLSSLIESKKTQQQQSPQRQQQQQAQQLLLRQRQLSQQMAIQQAQQAEQAQKLQQSQVFRQSQAQKAQQLQQAQQVQKAQQILQAQHTQKLQQTRQFQQAQQQVQQQQQQMFQQQNQISQKQQELLNMQHQPFTVNNVNVQRTASSNSIFPASSPNLIPRNMSPVIPAVKDQLANDPIWQNQILLARNVQTQIVALETALSGPLPPMDRAKFEKDLVDSKAMQVNVASALIRMREAAGQPLPVQLQNNGSSGQSNSDLKQFLSASSSQQAHEPFHNNSPLSRPRNYPTAASPNLSRALPVTTGSMTNFRMTKNDFLKAWAAFMSRRGTPVKSVPQIDGSPVDLHKLFMVVLAVGGHEKVSRGNMWPIVAAQAGFASNSTAKHDMYSTYMAPFEELYLQARQNSLQNQAAHFIKSTHTQGNTQGLAINTAGQSTQNLTEQQKEQRRLQQQQQQLMAQQTHQQIQILQKQNQNQQQASLNLNSSRSQPHSQTELSPFPNLSQTLAYNQPGSAGNKKTTLSSADIAKKSVVKSKAGRPRAQGPSSSKQTAVKTSFSMSTEPIHQAALQDQESIYSALTGMTDEQLASFKLLPEQLAEVKLRRQQKLDAANAQGAAEADLTHERLNLESQDTTSSSTRTKPVAATINWPTEQRLSEAKKAIEGFILSINQNKKTVSTFLELSPNEQANVNVRCHEADALVNKVDSLIPFTLCLNLKMENVQRLLYMSAMFRKQMELLPNVFILNLEDTNRLSIQMEKFFSQMQSFLSSLVATKDLTPSYILPLLEVCSIKPAVSSYTNINPALNSITNKPFQLQDLALRSSSKQSQKEGPPSKKAKTEENSHDDSLVRFTSSRPASVSSSSSDVICVLPDTQSSTHDSKDLKGSQGSLQTLSRLWKEVVAAGQISLVVDDLKESYGNLKLTKHILPAAYRPGFLATSLESAQTIVPSNDLRKSIRPGSHVSLLPAPSSIPDLITSKEENAGPSSESSSGISSPHMSSSKTMPSFKGSLPGELREILDDQINLDYDTKLSVDSTQNFWSMNQAF